MLSRMLTIRFSLLILVFLLPLLHGLQTLQLLRRRFSPFLPVIHCCGLARLVLRSGNMYMMRITPLFSFRTCLCQRNGSLHHRLNKRSRSFSLLSEMMRAGVFLSFYSMYSWIKTKMGRSLSASGVMGIQFRLSLVAGPSIPQVKFWTSGGIIEMAVSIEIQNSCILRVQHFRSTLFHKITKVLGNKLLRCHKYHVWLVTGLLP